MTNETNRNRTECLLGKIAKGATVVTSGALLGMYYPANSVEERVGAIIGSVMFAGFVAYMVTMPTDYRNDVEDRIVVF